MVRAFLGGFVLALSSLAPLAPLAPLARLSAQGQPAYSPPSADAIIAPERTPGVPLITCTATELGRLRTAYRDRVSAIVAPVVAARARLAEPLVFPPRGGQHNQWYQCEVCQLGLQTVDATHHRCPRCKKIYSGAPYDDVVFSRVHGRNCKRAVDAAWAFALTGEARFAADAARILVGYADRYRRYPYHKNSRGGGGSGAGGGHIKEQSLSEASMMIGYLLPAYDLIWPRLDAEQRRHIAADLIRPMVENVARSRRGKSNWQSFHNAAMFAGGALLGDAAWMRRSILAPANGFWFQLGACVSRDGMWYENSWGYHLYTMQALAAHAEAARRCGIDLWGHPKMRKMAELPLQYAMPDGSLPRFGDDVQSRLPLASSVFEAAAAVLRSDQIALGLRDGATWHRILHGRDSPSEPSGLQPRCQLFAANGHGILFRAQPKTMAVVQTFGKFGGFHGHFDKLSFVFFGPNGELGVDPGRARSQAYRLPIHRQWYRGTIAHNAVVVDGQPQRGASGKLLLFEDRLGYQAVAASCETAYPGVCHARCLVLMPQYLLVLDVLEAVDVRGAGGVAGGADAVAKQRRFDWVYHNRSATVTSDSSLAMSKPSESLDLQMRGAQFVDSLRTGTTRGAVGVRFGKPGRLHVIIAADGTTQVFTGTGPGASILDRVPLVIARRTGSRVVFVAVLEPMSAGAPEVREVHQWREKEGVRVVVDRGANTDRFTWDGKKGLQVSID